MGQAIERKGIVTGRSAMALQRALDNTKADPEKAKRLKEALQFHREVKVIKK